MSYLLDKRKTLSGQTLERTGIQAGQPQSADVQAVQQPQAKSVGTQTAQTAEEQQTVQTKSTDTQAVQTPSAVTPAVAETTEQGTASVADQAQQLLSKQQGYVSSWGNSIEDVLSRLMNPDEFSYDVNSDPLYLQLRDQYMRDGQLAMEDTMGQAAQLTGGYGNSYAQMLGQQTYQGYLKQVNDMVPELREAARADYDAQQDVLLQQYGLLMDQEEQDYSRYLDELENQRYEDELAYSREQDALENRRYEDELTYSRGQDAYDRLLELIVSTGYTPTDEELAAAGMTASQAKAWRSYYYGSSGTSGSGSSSGTSGSGSSSSSTSNDGELTQEDVDELLTLFPSKTMTQSEWNALIAAGISAESLRDAGFSVKSGTPAAKTDGDTIRSLFEKKRSANGSLSTKD